MLFGDLLAAPGQDLGGNCRFYIKACSLENLLALLATILLLEHPDTILAMVPVQENILPLTSQLLGQGDQVSRDQVLMVTILLLLPVNMRALLQPHGPLLYTTDLIPR